MLSDVSAGRLLSKRRSAGARRSSWDGPDVGHLEHVCQAAARLCPWFWIARSQKTPQLVPEPIAGGRKRCARNRPVTLTCRPASAVMVPGGFSPPLKNVVLHPEDFVFTFNSSLGLVLAESQLDQLQKHEESFFLRKRGVVGVHGSITLTRTHASAAASVRLHSLNERNSSTLLHLSQTSRVAAPQHEQQQNRPVLPTHTNKTPICAVWWGGPSYK